MNIAYIVGKKIGSLAHQHGKTQKELANKHGVSISTIQRIFSGKTDPHSSDLLTLLQEFGVDVLEIVNEKLLQSHLESGQTLNNERELSSALGHLVFGLDAEFQRSLLSMVLRTSKDAQDPTSDYFRKRLLRYLDTLNQQERFPPGNA